jgi:putative flippase GtrA
MSRPPFPAPSILPGGSEPARSNRHDAGHMTTSARLRPWTAPRAARASIHPPTVDVVIPVYNEEGDLERSVRRLHDFLHRDFPWPARITIVDNASQDGTLEIARRLSTELAHVDVLRLDEKGRGRALRAAWSASDAAVVAYMDVDLSTDLRALLPLVAPLLSGHSDIAIGSRLLPGSSVRRGLKRELISRGYNLLLRTTLRTRFRDAQCGFKALRADTARRLLPEVQDQRFFFDTELLVLAQRNGLRIHEVAVDWTDDPDSRVDLVATALADLRGIARVGTTAPGGAGPRRLARFAAIGAVSTAAYILLYAALRMQLSGPVANALALVVTAAGNTAANRHLTFGVRGRRHRVRHHLGGIAALLLALGITTVAVDTLGAVDHGASRPLEVTVLVGANLLATAVRYRVLRRMLARPSARPQGTRAGVASGAPSPLMGAMEHSARESSPLTAT